MVHRMRMSQQAADEPAPSESRTCRFDEISSPGLYLEHRTGALLRVPREALTPGNTPAVEVVASWTVTRLSDDPYLPLSEARIFAAYHGLVVDV